MKIQIKDSELEVKEITMYYKDVENYTFFDKALLTFIDNRINDFLLEFNYSVDEKIIIDYLNRINPPLNIAEIKFADKYIIKFAYNSQNYFKRIIITKILNK